MKKFTVIIIGLLFFIVGVVGAKEITLNFAWTPNTETDMAGYTLYKRGAWQQYDYNNPDDVVPCIMTGNDCIPAEGSITWEALDGSSSTYCFVARAYDTGNNFSEDSNEVSKVIDLTILPMPTNFTGTFNDVEDTVNLIWEQSQSDRIKRWIVMYGDANGGPYPESYEVENTGQTSYIATIPIVVPPETLITKYFVVKGMADWDIESQTSSEVAVEIYKDIAPSAVINLHFKVE